MTHDMQAGYARPAPTPPRQPTLSAREIMDLAMLAGGPADPALLALFERAERPA